MISIFFRGLASCLPLARLWVRFADDYGLGFQFWVTSGSFWKGKKGEKWKKKNFPYKKRETKKKQTYGEKERKGKKEGRKEGRKYGSKEVRKEQKNKKK